jgi:glycosyltransferase involved in cell wall biosynthesis
MARAVAFVLKGYPRLSETFIAQEIHALEQAGLNIRIVSLRHPTDKTVHPIHRDIAASVTYLPEYLYQAPMRVITGLRAARLLPGWGAAWAQFRRDLRRDPTPNRLRRFGQAAVLAHELGDDVARLHAHFLHTPASVTRYAAMLRRLPWSASAHAVDIWTTPAWEKREKLEDCVWTVTCSETARADLAALADVLPEGAGKVRLVYHGIDLARFPPPPVRSPRDGADPANPVILLTVGRAVEKKGHDVLIAALAGLPETLHWRWVHIGGGELAPDLKRQAAALGVADRIDWRGSQSQERVIEAYRQADLFVLANRIAANGDRDGLPNVLVEAQSQGLACVASNAAAVPELITDGVNGRLVAPDDAAALTGTLAALIADPATRQTYGAAGRKIVEARFDHRHGIDRLAKMFAADGLLDLGAAALPPTPRAQAVAG